MFSSLHLQKFFVVELGIYEGLKKPINLMTLKNLFLNKTSRDHPGPV
jgi:hypothetical protein